MGVNNILNPDPTSPFNPEYPFDASKQEERQFSRAADGDRKTRRVAALGRIYNLTWNSRSPLIAQQLQQWAAQYEDDFFTLADWDRNRFFSGAFMGPLKETSAGYYNITLTGQFEEIPKLPMFTYPTDWDNDSKLYNEQDSQGTILPGVNGTWPVNANANAMGGSELLNAGLDNTHFAKLEYNGYGCRVICRKAPSFGKCEISIDDNVVSASLDLYSAANVVAMPDAPVFSYPNLAYGRHQVKIRALHTKNAGSSDYKVPFDAIQVIT